MFKSYFKIAWRNLVKNRAYSTINILGLSAGMGVALLIGLWIWDEVSYNKNFENYDRIVRVMETINHGGEINTGQAVPLPLGAPRYAVAAVMRGRGRASPSRTISPPCTVFPS